MIIEDRHSDIVDLDDDRDDFDPQPPDDEPPMPLDEIEAFLAYAQGGAEVEGYDRDAAKDILLDVAIPQMLAELRYWQADNPPAGDYSDEPPF
jgi:hypothetical protein